MGAVTSRNAALFASTGGGGGLVERMDLWKSNRQSGAVNNFGAGGVGRPQTMCRWEGIPGAIAGPTGAVFIPTRATTGMVAQTDPTGSPLRQKWITGLTSHSLTQPRGVYTVLDRLAVSQSLVANINTAQTITSMIPTRSGAADTCLENELWLEIWGTLGATPTTVTANYKNENGVDHNTRPVTVGGTGFNEIDRCIKLPKASGDRGIKQVNSLTFLATTGTAGSCCVVLAKPKFDLAIGSGSPFAVSLLRRGPVEIVVGEALYMITPVQLATQLDEHLGFTLAMLEM